MIQVRQPTERSCRATPRPPQPLPFTVGESDPPFILPDSPRDMERSVSSRVYTLLAEQAETYFRTSRFMTNATRKWTKESLLSNADFNSKVVDAQYAVRGDVVARSAAIDAELKNPETR